MSRLGKQPITIPSGVEVSKDGITVTVKGPKGTLTRDFPKKDVAIEVTAEGIATEPANDSVFARSLWGTYASHLRNMIVGVTEGYQKNLELEGVGFRWALSGTNLEMQLGFSHPVIMTVPEGLEVNVEKNKMSVAGIDKEAVTAFAAKIRAKKKPEPYKGKGIRYQGEEVRRKQGKKSV